MRDREEILIEALEKQNKEIRMLKMSKEYKFGKQFYTLLDSIRELNMKKILNYIKMRKKTKIVQKKYTQKIPGIANMSSEREIELIKPDRRNKKYVVYTCITGNYDKLQEPLLKFENVDFVCFTEDNSIQGATIWEYRKIPETISKLKSNILINRYIKMHPHEMFVEEGYDYAFYIDGNVKIISDISSLLHLADSYYGLAMHKHVLRECIYKEIESCIVLGKGDAAKLELQYEQYYSAGFPQNYGMLEGTIILSDLNSEKAKEILIAWWEEFEKSKSMRDQIALPYVLWKKEISVEDVGLLGENEYMSPKFSIIIH